MKHDPSRQEALEKARELEELSRNLNANFEHASLHREIPWWQRFASRDRKNFWRMPVWLWAPAVAVLVALFVLALLRVGGHLAT